MLARLDALAWLGPLTLRIFFGYFWFETGLAKLQNLDAFSQRFLGWGIPFPTFSAALSGGTDMIGGALLIVGLFTRLATIPMIINMVVAIAVVVQIEGGAPEVVAVGVGVERAADLRRFRPFGGGDVELRRLHGSSLTRGGTFSRRGPFD